MVSIILTDVKNSMEESLGQFLGGCGYSFQNIGSRTQITNTVSLPISLHQLLDIVMQRMFVISFDLPSSSLGSLTSIPY